MATELAKAYVQIVPSAQGISGSLTSILDGEASKAGDSAGKKMGGSLGSALGGALKTGVAVTAALGTAAIGAGTALAGAASSVAQYGDNIDKMSQKMGMSATAYQEWDAVMQHSGTSMETMKSSMKTLANAAETGNEAFKKLGITEKDLQTMNQEQLFEATIAGLQQVDDTTQRTYLAGQLLGRGATELGALLNTSAEDTQAMRDRVHELGGVMSDEAVKNSAAFQDSLQDLQTAFTGVKNGIISDMLPSFTSVMDGFASLITGEEGAKEKITEGIKGIIDKVKDDLPKIVEGFSTLAQSFMEVAPELLSALAKGLLDAIPQLLPSLVKLVGEIAKGIIELLPQLIEVGMQVIVELALGLAQALPDLVPTLVDTMLMIVDTLIDNIDLLVDASIAIITGLAEGLINALPKLIEKAPEIIQKLVDALIKNIPKIIECAGKLILELAQALIKNLPQIVKAAGEIIGSLVTGIVNLVSKVIDAGKKVIESFKEGLAKFDPRKWGKDLLDNFIQGIKDKIGDLKDACHDIANKIKDILGFSEPKEGPLSNFHTYAPDMMKLFAKGIRDNEDLVQRQVEQSFDFTPYQEVMVQTSATSTYEPATEQTDDGIMIRIESLLNKYLPNIGTDMYLDGDTLVGSTKNRYNDALGRLAVVGATR